MSKTLAQLRTNVRMILDEVSEADWTDTQINTELNYCYMEMYTSVLEVYEDYYRTVATDDLTANINEYALPDNFLKIRRLEIKYQSTDDYTKASRFSFDQINRAYDSTNVGSTARPIYEFSGNYLRILPVPTTTVTGADAIRMVYIKQIDELDSDSDEIDIPFANRYAKYLVKGACAQLLSKGQQEERVAAVYEDYFQRGLEKMKTELELRYADGVLMIQDVSNMTNDFGENEVITGIKL